MRGAYLPFSLGPRKCIGDHFAMMAMRSVMRALYSVATPRFEKPPSFEFEAGITMRPSTALNARLEPSASRAARPSL